MKNILINYIRKHNLAKGTLHNDFTKCLYCGKCQRCRAKAITVDSKAKEWKCDDEKCVRCGHCVMECPVKSLSFVK